MKLDLLGLLIVHVVDPDLLIWCFLDDDRRLWIEGARALATDHQVAVALLLEPGDIDVVNDFVTPQLSRFLLFKCREVVLVVLFALVATRVMPSSQPVSSGIRC